MKKKIQDALTRLSDLFKSKVMPKIKNQRSNILHILLLLLFAALITFFAEYIIRKTLPLTLRFLLESPVQFLNSTVIIFLFMLTLLGAFGNIFVPVLSAGGIMIALSVASSLKMLYRNEPVVPWDIYALRETLKISNTTKLSLSSDAVISIIALLCLLGALIFLAVKFKFRPRFRRLTRVLIPICSLFSLSLFISCTLLNGAYLSSIGASITQWDQTQTTMENGLLPALVMNFKLMTVEKPDSYDEKSISDILSNYDFEADDGSSPDIIVIMSESFCDIQKSKNITFDRELTPTINEISENYISGVLYTPQYGGGTSNCEFEVLTGFSNYFFTPGMTPYQQYVNGPTPSFASYLKSKGYTTEAVHPYERTFWKRDLVYEYFGFDNFFTTESFENATLFQNLYISDTDFVNKIIERYEQNVVSSDSAPYFSFNVSMQNHGSYYEYNCGGIELVGAESDTVNGNLTLAARIYATGLTWTDESVKRLVEYFEKSERDVVIVFFGDHLPVLTTGGINDFYELGYAESDLDIYSVPYFIWNNFEAKTEKRNMSLYNLLPYMTNTLDVERPAFFDFLYDSLSYYSGQLPSTFIDENGNTPSALSPAAAEIQRRYKLLQYDLLFGERYSEDVLTK